MFNFKIYLGHKAQSQYLRQNVVNQNSESIDFIDLQGAKN